MKLFEVNWSIMISDSLRMGGASLCVQIHGDAALAGQGINQETLQIANVPHYSVGGSLHLVINNQVYLAQCPSVVLVT